MFFYLFAFPSEYNGFTYNGGGISDVFYEWESVAKKNKLVGAGRHCFVISTCGEARKPVIDSRLWLRVLEFRESLWLGKDLIHQSKLLS